MSTEYAVAFQGAAKQFFKPLVEEGTAAVLKAADVEHTTSRKDLTVTLTGSTAHAQALPVLWSVANREFHVWKREDEAYRAARKANDRAFVAMENEWFKAFCAGVALRVAGKPLPKRAGDATRVGYREAGEDVALTPLIAVAAERE